MAADMVVRNIAQLATAHGTTALAGSRQASVETTCRAAIAVTDGLITHCGPEDAVSRSAAIDSGTIELDARGGVVTPGLVDCHTHLVFAGDRLDEFEARVLGADYADLLALGGGILATVRATRAATADELEDTTATRLATMLAHGTTTVEAKSGYGLDLETEIKQLQTTRRVRERQPVEIVPTFLGAHATPPGESTETFCEWLCEVAIPAVAREDLAEFCDVFCEDGAFAPEQAEAILYSGLRNGLKAKIHADELGDSGGAGVAAGVGAVSADHLHWVSDSGISKLAAAGVIAVLLPGTALYLGISRHAPARQMVDAGVPIALGTDFNPGSCYSESMPLAISLACTQLHLSPAEALVAATQNAACAVNRGCRIGTIEPGKQADLVIWDAVDYREIPYHMGVNLARVVLKRGEMVMARAESGPDR